MSPFFPQIISGPIERPGKFFSELAAFAEKRLFVPGRIRDGFLLFFWGLFKKLVLAERLSVISGTIFGQFEKRGFWELAIAACRSTATSADIPTWPAARRR